MFAAVVHEVSWGSGLGTRNDRLYNRAHSLAYTLQSWRLGQYVPPKCRYLPTRIRDVATQIIIWMNMIMNWGESDRSWSTKCPSVVVSTRASYSETFGFELRTGGWLYWLEIFFIFLSLCTRPAPSVKWLVRAERQGLRKEGITFVFAKVWLWCPKYIGGLCLGGKSVWVWSWPVT
jgi:hypothetical protein